MIDVLHRFKLLKFLIQPSNLYLYFNKENIRYIGYCKTLSEYSKWLYLSDILPVTNIQDFFGISIVEAVYCGTYPLLPKRLTYPDLFNYKKNSKLFYTNKNDLFYKLKHCINSVDQIRHSSYSSLVKRFDWRELIAEYDAQFLSVVNSTIPDCKANNV